LPTSEDDASGVRRLGSTLEVKLQVRLAGPAVAAGTVAVLGQVLEAPGAAAHGLDHVSFGNSATQAQDHLNHASPGRVPYPILKVDFK
jgi:hypothetical protein